MGYVARFPRNWKRLIQTKAQEVQQPHVSTISEKVIKPSSPTPSTHKLHKLSLVEQAQTHTYVPFGFFYTKEQLGDISNHPSQISNLLANSLSKNLSFHNPYAGTLKDNATVECNDVGAKLFEVKINYTMSEVYNHPDSSIKDLIFPHGLAWADDSPHGLAILQLSHFECGGIALSTCLSHKIGDAISTQYFMSDWATLTRDPNAILSPYYVQDSFFPSPNGIVIPPILGSQMDGCVQKRYIFSTSSLRSLKTYVSETSEVKNPTRTEVISALIFKSIVGMAKAKANLGSFKPSTLCHFADLRGLITPRLPSRTIGNLLSTFSTTIADEGDMNVPKLVSLMRKEKQLFFNKDNVKENKWVSDIVEIVRNGGVSPNSNEYNEFICSSTLQTPFKEVDFGWGKPVRVTIANGALPNVFGMLDQGNEVEAVVMLNEQDVPMFESDDELFKFASPISNL